MKSIPRYFSKFSNKIFCNHQKIILLVLKQKLRTTYRDLIEILKISDIPLYLGLKRIPHPTTLIKFAKKIKPGLLNLLLPHRKAKHVGVDASGFELDQKSYYYRTIYNSDRRQKAKRYMKLSLSVDTDKCLILKQKIRRKEYRHQQTNRTRQLARIHWWRQKQKALALRELKNIEEKAYNANIFISPPTSVHYHLLSQQ